MAAVIGPRWRECFGRAANKAGWTPKQAQIESAFLRAQGDINRNLNAGMSKVDAVEQAARDYAARQKLALALAKRDRLRNQMLAHSLDNESAAGGAKAPREVLLRVDRERYGLTAELLGPLIADMRKEGILGAVLKRTKALDLDVARELWRLNDPASGAATGNRVAEAAAKLIHRSQEAARNLQNQAGAWINKADHYIVRQSHDMEKVRGDYSRKGPNSAFQRWYDAILPKLDPKTFAHLDDPADIPEFLEKVWLNLAAGLHDTANPEVLKGYSGPGNLAKQLSAERVLHFKSADDWFAYNQQFGKGAVIDTAAIGLTKAARNVALMRTFGTNPEAMYQGWITRMLSKARDEADGATLDALRKYQRRNENILHVIDGSADIPQDMTLAKIGAITRAVQTMTKLGGVVLSSIPDLAVNAASLRHMGVPLFHAYAGQIVGLLPRSAEGRLIADRLLVGVDGLMANVMHKFHGEDGALGVASSLVDKYHKLSLLTWWTDSLKQTAGMMISNRLAEDAGKAFGALDPLMQRTLQRHGIDAAEWDLARQMTMEAADGRNYMLPAGVADLDDALFASAMHKSQLQTKLSTLIADQVREGLTEPNANIRAMMTGGMARGSLGGEAMRIWLQFKTYPVTFYQRTMAREGLALGDFDRSAASLFGAGHLVAMTGLLGYLSFTLKDFAAGKLPREPEDAKGYGKLVMRAMTQGGGLGIYGDFLFGEANRLGGGWLSSLAGPTGGTLSAVGDLYGSLRDGALKGDVGKLGAQSVQFAKQHVIPNLFWTKAAADQLIWYRLQEAMNPGYLARYEARVRRENSQDFVPWLAPTAAR